MLIQIITSLIVLQLISVLSKNLAFADLNHNPFKNQPCVTPDLVNGTCRYINYCEKLKKIHQRDVLYKDDLKYLWQSQCGYFNNRPMLCCPNKIPEEKQQLPIEPINRLNTINKLPNYSVCGQMSYPITSANGTQRTQIYEHPWMALLEYTKPNSKNEFHCGGALINNRYVLTAAHCICGTRVKELKLTLISVRLGDWDLHSTIDCDGHFCAPPAQNIPVEKMIAHENYKPKQLAQYNDIALIRLSRQVKYTEWIRPICLPSDPNSKSVYDSNDLRIVGWGHSEDSSAETMSQYKKHGFVTGLHLDECTKIYHTKYGISINPSQLCVLGTKTDMCKGDSGGPLIALGNNTRNIHRQYLNAVGIRSAIGPRNCEMPIIYTRTSYYVRWILERIWV